MGKGIEKPVVFQNEGMQLVGMLHSPEHEDTSPAVIFFHGCTGTKSEAHWLFVKLARALASKGIMVLRFDFRFSGDSEGDFERMTVSGEISDGLRAVDFLVEECGADPQHVGLLGLSLGGVVAAEVAGRLGNRIESCALLNPVARPYADIGAIASMNNVETQSFPVEFNSFLFGYEFASDIKKHVPLETIRNAACPVLVINGSGDRAVDPERSREYINAIKDCGGEAELHIMEGADHTFTSAQWERQLSGKVTEWFQKTLR